MNKRVLSLVLALVMILTMVPMTAMAASVSDFSDVEQGKWYYTWIDNVAKEGYYAGYTDGTFRPNETMTRAMFVMVLANMEEAELDNSTSAFKDVEAGKWYTGATKWAADNKIVAGYTDGTFKPDAIVTREQMATIMQNYINWRSAETGEIHETDGSTEKFADDAKISKYAKEAVANCREWDLIAGYTDGTFRPQNGSTRAEVAAVVSKLAWMVMGGTTTTGTKTYSVTYYANAGGDDVTNMPGKVTGLEKGDEFTVAAGPLRDGYSFEGWNTKANGTGTEYVVGEDYEVTANVKLYAQWEEDEVNVAENDFIYWAAYEAVEDGEAKYKEYFEDNWKGSSLKLSDITVSDEIDANGARPQTVTWTGILSKDAVKELCEMAIDVVVGMINDGDLTQEEIEDEIDDMVEELEDRFGVDLFEDMTWEDLADQIWDKVDDASYLWDYFHNGEGAYYTGDITVTVGDVSLTVKVDETNDKIYFDETTGKTWDKAEDLAVAIAEELHESLKKESNGQYITDAKVSFVMDIDFSVPTENIKVTAADADGNAALMETTYAENAAKFPTCYPVTFVLDYQNKDELDTVAYKFVEGKGDFIKLTVYEKDYIEALEDVVEYALEDNEWVKDEAEELVEETIDQIQSNEVFEDVIDALAEFLRSETAARNIADTYVRIWTNDNMDVEDLYNTNVFDMIWNDKDAEDVLDNAQIYALVKYTSERAAEYAKEEIEKEAAGWGVTATNPVKSVMQNATPDSIKESLDVTGVDLAVNPKVDEYVCAVVADWLREHSNSMNPTNYAAAREAGMKDAINELIAEQVDKEIESHERYDDLQDALKFKNIDHFVEATLGDFAEFLRYEDVQDEADSLDKFVDEVVDLFKEIPRDASVTINGKKINKDSLDGIRTAVKAVDVLDAVADLFEDPALKDICIGDFAPEDGMKITAEYDDYDGSFYLVIDVIEL